MEQDMIYLHKKQYYTNRIYHCKECEAGLDDTMFWITKYFQKRKENIRLCNTCAILYKNKKTMKGIVEEVKVVGYVDVIPRGAEILLMSAPHIQNSSSMNSFMAADRIDEAHVIDSTVHAGRESFHGASIGADVKEYIEAKDRPLEENEAKDLLAGLMAAEIDYGDNKRIEQKEDKQDDTIQKD